MIEVVSVIGVMYFAIGLTIIIFEYKEYRSHEKLLPLIYPKLKTRLDVLKLLIFLPVHLLVLLFTNLVYMIVNTVLLLFCLLGFILYSISTLSVSQRVAEWLNVELRK